jgi:inosine/xanthosine triphosphatase
MDVAVGSENPVKRRAVERVFESATVETRAVESGVSEQPVGHTETIAGARTRARESFGTDVAFGVGLEGGVAEFTSSAERPTNGVEDDEFNRVDGLFLIMWAAVTDGKRIEIGAGPSVRLPDSIAREVVSGAELGPLLDERLETNDSASVDGRMGSDSIAERSSADNQTQSDSITESNSANSRIGSDSIARGQGAIGVFTGGRITREGALADAVACAASHLLDD